MYDCSHYRSQMMEYLYDLLSEAEGQALLEHVTGCEACRAAFDEAQRHQGLLASAARLSFPEVRFDPPPESPTTLPLPTLPASPVLRRLRWAAAAVVLLALGGAALFGLRSYQDYAALQQDVVAHEARIEEARRAVAASATALAALPEQLRERTQATLQSARLRQLNVVVTGPARAPVGAPSEYRIATQSPDGRPVRARLDLRVIDEQGAVVLEQKNVASPGQHRLTLEPSLPLIPGRALALEVAARREGDRDPASVLRERIELAAPTYVTQFATDKPIYFPGETVYFRSLTLERFSLRPPDEDLRLVYRLKKPGEERDLLTGPARLSDPVAGEVMGPDGRPLRGIGSGAWTVPADAPAGEYTLEVREASNRFVPERVRFFVHRPGTVVKPPAAVPGEPRVEFFPEGGDLIAGLPNRVYFQARTATDRPAELRGQVVDDTGKRALEVSTLHHADLPGVNRGLGSFTFTPEVGRTYELTVPGPSGATHRFRLPPVKSDGVVLHVPTGTTRPGEPIRARLQATGGERTLLVGAYCRGRLLAHQRLTVKPGTPAEAELRPLRETGGVYRITVFEERDSLVPVAERLVFREPAERLQVEVSADRAVSGPGERVTLTVTARDEQGRPAAAVVLLRVVDRGLLSLTGEATTRGLPAHFLLASEVRKAEDLEQADFLLSDRPEARTALDLLLGTQGWRRFAEQQPERFRQQYARDADRVLVSVGTATVDFRERELGRVREELQTRHDELRAENEKSVATLRALLTEESARARTEELRRAEDRWHALRRGSVPALAALLVLLVVVGLLRGVPRSLRWAVPLYSALGLGVVVLLGVAAQDRGTERERMARREQEQKRRQDVEQLAFGGGRSQPGVDPARPDRDGPHIMLNQGSQGRKPNEVGVPRPPVDGPAFPRPLPERGPVAGAPGDEGAPKPAFPPGGGPRPFEPPPPPLVVREYAHLAPERNEAAPSPDTLLWKPVVILSSEGKATVSFDLPKAAGSFEATAAAHTLAGRLGNGRTVVEVRPTTK